MRRLAIFSLLAAASLHLSTLRAAEEPPRDWVDSDTGHRVIRLSSEPGSSTLYFHDNSYSPQGDKLIFNSPSGIVLVDVTQLGKEPPKPEVAVPGGRGGGAGGQAPAPKNASASVKSWVKDGALTKYILLVKGTVSFGGEEREMDRTTTTEFKNIGSTKVTVPEEAKKKLGT